MNEENEDIQLTPREFEVLRLVAEGLRNAQIALRLVLAVDTVEGHLENISRKLGLRGRTALAKWLHDRDDRIASTLVIDRTDSVLSEIRDLKDTGRLREAESLASGEENHLLAYLGHVPLLLPTLRHRIWSSIGQLRAEKALCYIESDPRSQAWVKIRGVADGLLDLAKEWDDDELLGAASHTKAMAYYVVGDHTNALEWRNRALALPISDLNRMLGHRSQAISCARTGHQKEAQYHQDRALKIMQVSSAVPKEYHCLILEGVARSQAESGDRDALGSMRKALEAHAALWVSRGKWLVRVQQMVRGAVFVMKRLDCLDLSELSDILPKYKEISEEGNGPRFVEETDGLLGYSLAA